MRKEGDANDINTKGLVTCGRRIRKDAYYFHKANWTQTPTVHITGRRYVDRAYAVTSVRVYSNAPRTELLLNGRSLGVREACPQSTACGKRCGWLWERIALSRALGVGAAEDGTWTLAPAAAKAVRIDSGALVAGAVEGRRFGSDAFFEGGKP